MKMRFFPDDIFGGGGDTGGATSGGSTEAMLDGPGTFSDALGLPDLDSLLDGAPADPITPAPVVPPAGDAVIPAKPAAPAPLPDTPEYYKAQAEQLQPLVEEHGSIETVKAWADFGNTFMDPNGNAEQNYNLLANKNPAMFFDMLNVAAQNETNRDHFASLALGTEVSADQVRALVEAVGERDPGIVGRAIEMIERMEAEDTDLDAYLPAKEAGANAPEVDPEKARLQAELDTFKQTQMKETIRTRREAFESKLDAPINAELAKVDFADVNRQWKEATGFDFDLTEVLADHVRKSLVKNPKFGAAHRHAIDGNEVGVAQYMPALSTIVTNMTRRALAGIGAIAGTKRTRTATTIQQIESERRLSGGLDAPTSTGGDSLDALFDKRLKAGANPFDAMADLEGLL